MPLMNVQTLTFLVVRLSDFADVPIPDWIQGDTLSSIMDNSAMA